MIPVPEPFYVYCDDGKFYIEPFAILYEVTLVHSLVVKSCEFEIVTSDYVSQLLTTDNPPISVLLLDEDQERFIHHSLPILVNVTFHRLEEDIEKEDRCQRILSFRKFIDDLSGL